MKPTNGVASAAAARAEALKRDRWKPHPNLVYVVMHVRLALARVSSLPTPPTDKAIAFALISAARVALRENGEPYNPDAVAAAVVAGRWAAQAAEPIAEGVEAEEEQAETQRYADVAAALALHQARVTGETVERCLTAPLEVWAAFDKRVRRATRRPGGGGLHLPPPALTVG